MNIDKGLALHNQPTGVETVVFSQEDYTQVSKLSRVEKRKLLRSMVKSKPVGNMTYEQAKLYHRLKGRIT